MDKKIGFAYGVLCDPLEEQAQKQGYTLGDEAEICEKIRYSINMCSFHVATESQVAMMFKKLNKKVFKSLTSLNNKCPEE